MSAHESSFHELLATGEAPVSVVGSAQCYSTRQLNSRVFIARRYASAVYAVVMCPTVTSRYCIETTGRIKLVFGMEASVHLSQTVL